MAATVTIACKLPAGLVLEMPKGGPFNGRRVTLLGGRIVRDDNGMPISDRTTPGGFGLTFGVDKDFWDAWLALHKEFPPVVKGAIFAMDKPADATAMAKEMADVKTGLEPKDPEKLPGNLKTLDVKE